MENNNKSDVATISVDTANEQQTKEQTELEKKKIENIEAAHILFKNLIRHENYHKNKKFSHLDIDLRFKANQFNNELNTFSSKKVYQKYERGQVVSVNFGTNIGDELSGEHFAIVLTKKDSRHSSLLTVVPLTSKENKHYIPLGKEVWYLLMEQIFRLSKPYLDSYNQIKEPLINFATQSSVSSKYTTSETYDNIKENDLDKIIIELTSWSNVLKDIDENKLISLKQSFKENYNQEQINFVLNTSKIPENVSQEDFKTTKFVFWLLNDDHNFNNFLFIYNRSKIIIELLQKYMNKNKDSYAIVNQITTISKNKIRRQINDYDPLGKIKIDDTILKVIDEEILNQFTNYIIQEKDDEKVFLDKSCKNDTL